MRQDPTTLADLVALLAPFDPAAALVFRTEGRDIRPGYLVTELKLAEITSIDCGRAVTQWQETVLQLMDGGMGAHMTTGAFSTIALQIRGAVAGIETHPLSIEFSHDNRGLQRFGINGIEAGNGRVTVTLRPTNAMCKAAQRRVADTASGQCG